MEKIVIEGIKLHAYHGCLEEEARIGTQYIIDVEFDVDIAEAAQTDDLTKTIDYCHVYTIVKEEMVIRSKLIEHVAYRIMERFKHSFQTATGIRLKLSKLRPPAGGEMEKASIVIAFKR